MHIQGSSALRLETVIGVPGRLRAAIDPKQPSA